MADREKVIKGLECMAFEDNVCRSDCPYFIPKQLCVEMMAREALDLLKEHESIVRCKDCKHRPIKPNECISGFDLAFADEVCPCYCQDGYYSWYPPDDWYCANGERR